jgi:endonuclease/exonuclease/phosphatase family metal-dependent hydrolase
MGKKLRKMVWVVFLGTNIIATLLYLLACLVPFFNPGTHWFIALLGLGFPVLLVVLLVFGVYWVLKRSKWALLSLAALLLGWKQISVCFGFHPLKTFTEAKAQDNIRILTWNLSSWGETSKNNRSKTDSRTEMINIIKSAHADILCFQEYVFDNKIHFRDSTIAELKDEGFQYGYFIRANYSMHLYKSAHVTGVVILSKYPIIDTAHFEYSENNFAEPLIYADIKVNDKMIRVFTTHLQSVRFEEYDYEALHNLKEPAEASVTQSRAVIWKLKQAYKKRGLQADELHQTVLKSPNPAILCGDFNDVPNSYTYFTAKGDLQDAFLQQGFGFDRTYHYLSPTLRIDYILADKKFTVEQYKKIKVPYSDHYPVVADIKINVSN